jgi:transketolase
MRVAFLETLHELAAKDAKVCLLTGDLGFTVVERFAKSYPDRFFNIGVAEANMVGLATGMALDGWVPYCYSMASFISMRDYEQVRNGPLLHRLPIRLIGIGGGFSYGHAGPTHYSLEDLAIMRTQPGMTVVAPADPAQTRNALRTCHGLPGPVYFQVGKGGDPELPGLEGRFALDGVETIGTGKKALLLTTGKISVEVAALAQELGEVTVGIAAALNPVPVRALDKLLGGFPLAFTIEEHFTQGGLGSLAAERIATQGHPTRLHILGVERYQPGVTGSRNFMLQRAGLDRASLLKRIRTTLESSRS